MLDMAAMKELLSKMVMRRIRKQSGGLFSRRWSAVKRETVAHLKAHLGLSERRACQIAGADRKTIRYLSRWAPDTELRGRLRDLANERRRFVYRRLFVLLRREGEPSGTNCIYLPYSED